jgi:gliding motility-associated-like protein
METPLQTPRATVIPIMAMAFLMLGHSHVLSQSACPNADFSQGNFSNWQGYTGTYADPSQTPGIVNGRHTVMTTPAIDPFTCGGLNVLPPGGTSSARLGNSNTGAQAEQLVYTLTVTPDNALFIYKYAVVLENPDDHLPEEQPEFRVRILDALGNQIGGNCGTYNVYGGQPGQNFQFCGAVTWLPWSTVGLDLTPYMGQNVLIEFTTRDCLLTGHFGYAYISAECAPMTVDQAYCAGDPDVTLTAPPGFQQYTWMPGNLSGQQITVPAPAQGTIFFCTMTTFSNQGNCEVELALQIGATSVTAEYGGETACEDAGLQFSDSSLVTNGVITSWTWDFDDGTSSTAQNPQHTFTDPGSYVVQLITGTAQGCTDTIFHEVDVYAAPAINFTSSGFCATDVVSFDNLSTDVFPVVYDWQFGDGSPIMQGLEGDHTYTTAGTYNVTLTATNSMGCVATMTNPTDQYPLPVVDAGPDVTICPGGEVILAASGAFSYDWNNGITDAVPFVPATTGMYTVTGTDQNGCVNVDSAEVFFYQQPVVDAGPDQAVCVGDAVTLAATGATSMQWSNGISDGIPFVPAIGTVTYIVQGTDPNGCVDEDSVDVLVHALPIVGAGNDITICPQSAITLLASGASSYSWDNNVTNGIPFQPAANGIYTVTGTDQNGCVNTDAVAVSIEAPVAVNFAVDNAEGCVPLDVTFTNLSSGGTNCLWEFSDGTNASGCGTIDHTFEDPGCYDVTLTTTTALGCVSDTTLLNFVCVYPNPLASFYANPSSMSELDPVTMMSNHSQGAVSYEWDFGDGGTSVMENPTHQYSEAIASYTITLLAISDHGCIDEAAVTVEVQPELIYYVPNTFTPDGDNFNEEFKPQFTSGFDPNTYHLYIYNRWGEIVFESRDIAYGWNGSFAGKIAQDGTYTWKIEFKSLDGNRSESKSILGHVNILK